MKTCEKSLFRSKWFVSVCLFFFIHAIRFPLGWKNIKIVSGVEWKHRKTVISICCSFSLLFIHLMPQNIIEFNRMNNEAARSLAFALPSAISNVSDALAEAGRTQLIFNKTCFIQLAGLSSLSCFELTFCCASRKRKRNKWKQNRRKQIEQKWKLIAGWT